MMEKPDAQKDALNTLKKLDPLMIVQTLMNSVHPKRNHVLSLLRMAPDFNLESLSDPSMLIKYGIWKEIKGWEELQTMPRYFAGRDIIVKATVNPVVGD